jgi:AraC-like DNA-binding protein
VSPFSQTSQIELYRRLNCARSYIDSNLHLPLDLDQISSQANFSRYHFIRLFRNVYNKTPHRYLTQKRIEKAKVLLTSGEMTITDICFAVGFQSLGSFSSLFYRATGYSPKVFRARFYRPKISSQKFVPSCYVITMPGLENKAV